MTSLIIYLLPAVVLAVFHFAAPAEKGSGLTGSLSRHNALRMLYTNMLESRRKRDKRDEYIWMPSHGYMPMHDNETVEPRENSPNHQGTILRYG